ncbi:hypothetical protein M135_4690 [Bacteroides fragilis str. S36L5]|nr:hypothetical protein M137_5181 [Bacteroides fragilis str. S36L12]EYA88763.1 hypothetical protein M135_4690 [Bacteroides fragilis str. S36L5]EYE61498.1 hypothetical protein M149_4498 [Bacteroides fragilis str. 1007-1-F \
MPNKITSFISVSWKELHPFTTRNHPTAIFYTYIKYNPR